MSVVNERLCKRERCKRESWTDVSECDEDETGIGDERAGRSGYLYHSIVIPALDIRHPSRPPPHKRPLHNGHIAVPSLSGSVGFRARRRCVFFFMLPMMRPFHCRSQWQKRTMVALELERCQRFADAKI